LSFLEHFRRFGRLPNAGRILVLTILAGLSEGIGLAVFVPLVAHMAGEGAALPPPFSAISTVMNALGLTTSPAMLLVAIVILMIASFTLILLQRNLISRAQYRFAQKSRTELFSALMNSRWSCLSRQSSGEALAGLVQAAERAGSAMHHLGLFVGGLPLLLIYCALSATLSWPLLLIAGALGVLMVLSTRPLMRQASRVGKEMTDAEENYTFNAVDRLRAAKLAKVTGSEKAVISTVVDIGMTVSEVKTAAQSNANMLFFVLQVGPVILIAAAIGIGASVLELPASLLLVFLLVMARVAPRLSSTQQAFQAYIVNAPALDQIDRRVQEFMIEAESADSVLPPFGGLTRDIGIDRVSYRYAEGDAPALEGIDLVIPNRSMVALVGPSGSGKSTLMELISGIRSPTGGRVLLDGTDLASLDPRSWRRRIGFVTQDTILLNDTLRANLVFSHPEAGVDEIESALVTAHLGDLVQELPDGLDTVLGEGGIRLSGGQRQRVALARALIGKPELLLLDEATSSLDNESESAIQKTLETIAHTMTIVVIAHRLTTVRNSDMIHVIEAGRLVESGSYDQLIAASGRFSVLHKAQFA
jgi:ATP-binding cassette, subfamily C, bacterial